MERLSAAEHAQARLRRISREHWTEWYDADQPFIAELRPGERVVVEVGKGSRIPTGPIGIAGAEPGDAVAVTIDGITLTPEVPGGSMNVNARPGRGFAGERIAATRSESFFRPLEIVAGAIVFRDDIRIPARPSVGVLATQPLGIRLPTIWPGTFGGNLDCHDVTPGSKVYLPVAVSGAGLYVGDIHAAIGDGEVMTSGAEVAGEIALSVEVVRGLRLEWPWLETADEVMVLTSARSIEAAAAVALEELSRFVTQQLGMPPDEAGLLVGLAGTVRVCQIVNPLVTVRAALPKAVGISVKSEE